MSDDTRPIDPQEPQDLKDANLERRRFLQILASATAYAPPALMAVLGNNTPAFAAKTSAASGSGSASSASSPKSSSVSASVSSSASASSAPKGKPGTLYPIADTTLRADDPDANEGANPRLIVGPNSRVVILFDRFELLEHIFAGGRATLVLRIANNHNDWPQTDDGTIEAWPLAPFDGDFVEGNGSALCRAGSEIIPATGEGATWNLADDLDCSNDNPDGLGSNWDGAGNVVQSMTAPPRIIVNDLTHVDISWDVTDDVMLNSVYGWMLKIGGGKSGGKKPGKGKTPPSGVDGSSGTVEFFSREGAAAAAHPHHEPKLVIKRDHDDGSSSSSSTIQSSSSSLSKG